MDAHSNLPGMAPPDPPKKRAGHTVAWAALCIGLDSIWTHKLRSVLTLLGVIIGVASVVTVGGAIEGFDAYVSGNLSSAFGSNTFIVARIVRAVSYEEYEEKLRRNKPIRLEDLRAVETTCGSCEALSPNLNAMDEAKYGSHVFYDGRISGVSPDLPKIQELELAEGRFISAFDVSHARPCAVIGWQIRDDLFGPMDALGREFRLGGDRFVVIGVEEKQGNFMGQSMDSGIYIPYTTFLKKYGLRRSIGFRVRALSEATLQPTQDDVRMILRARHKLKPGRDDDFEILSSDMIQKAISEFTDSVAMVITPITLISLLVGGIVIMNIMLMTVTARTAEIGMRKAVGATRGDILIQFLIESTLLAFLGGVFGILIAAAACEMIADTTPVPMRVTAGYVSVAVLISAAVGLISGIYPAYKASKLDPIVALERE